MSLSDQNKNRNEQSYNAKQGFLKQYWNYNWVKSNVTSKDKDILIEQNFKSLIREDTYAGLSDSINQNFEDWFSVQDSKCIVVNSSLMGDVSAMLSKSILSRFAILKGTLQDLTVEQLEYIAAIVDVPQTTGIYVFLEDGKTDFWITISKGSFDVVEEYAKLYMTLQKKFAKIKFDYMTVAEGKLHTEHMPISDLILKIK